MKKRKTFAVVSSVVLSIYLTILLPNQVTFADENIEERSEKKDVTTQTLYWQCVEAELFISKLDIGTQKHMKNVQKIISDGEIPNKYQLLIQR